MCTLDFHPLRELPDLQKRKSVALIEFSCFLSSFSIVTLLGHLDVIVCSRSCQGTDSHTSFLPSPPPASSSPPSQKSLFLEARESHQHVLRLRGLFAGRLCSRRWVTSAFFRGLLRKAEPASSSRVLGTPRRAGGEMSPCSVGDTRARPWSRKDWAGGGGWWSNWGRAEGRPRPACAAGMGRRKAVKISRPRWTLAEKGKGIRLAWKKRLWITVLLWEWLVVTLFICLLEAFRFSAFNKNIPC